MGNAKRLFAAVAVVCIGTEGGAEQFEQIDGNAVAHWNAVALQLMVDPGPSSIPGRSPSSTAPSTTP